MLYCGAQDNAVRLKRKRKEIDWGEMLKIGRRVLAKKVHNMRTYEVTTKKAKEYKLYFTNIPNCAVNYLVYRDDQKNKESKFYKLISSMDKNSELNKRIANQLFVSQRHVFRDDVFTSQTLLPYR